MTVRDLYFAQRNELQKQIDGVTAQLVGGKAKDFAEYKGMCGKISGLETAQKTLKETMQRYHSGEIDEDE